MSKNVVVFDCDDVLANLRDPLQDLVSEHLQKQVYWKDWDQYEIGKVYGFNFKPVCDKIVERKILESLKPEPNAKELVSYFKEQNFETFVLTARRYHPEGYNVTKYWLKKHNIEIDNVICIGLDQQKRDYLKNIPKVKVYIEDNHDHAEQAFGLDNVQQVFLMNRPWNQSISQCTRIDTLQDILDLKLKYS